VDVIVFPCYIRYKMMSEAALAKDWNSPEEDAAWAGL
jgi:hypothetical protein